jgi:hypothetical protein
MNRKFFLAIVLVLLASLLLSTVAFAQDDQPAAQTTTEEDVDLVPVEIRNRSDQTVFIVLTTIGLPEGTEGTVTADVLGSGASAASRTLANQVGTESETNRFYGLAAGPDETRTFTVERGVYFHRTTACGQTLDGVVDIRSQLRLVFVACGSSPANAGAPTQEKIAFPDPDEAPSAWGYRVGFD